MAVSTVGAQRFVDLTNKFAGLSVLNALPIAVCNVVNASEKFMPATFLPEELVARLQFDRWSLSTLATALDREHCSGRDGACELDVSVSARLFADSGADALRTAIAKACKAEGIALWSPHDLRHRRISLLHLRVPWARIAEFVGQRDLTVTANTYTHVLVDEAELDYAALLT